MFLFTITAEPSPGNVEIDDDIGGAYVNIWVNTVDEKEAELEARRSIRGAGWLPGVVDDASLVVEADYSNDHDSLQYFLKAQVDGICLVFHVWPKDAEDSNIDYEPGAET